MSVNLKLWEPVTKKSQIEAGSILKIVGFCEKNSYKRIRVKQVLQMTSTSGKCWTEVVINKRKNYFFHLDAYLNGEETWGKWVKELYVRRQPKKGQDDGE